MELIENKDKIVPKVYETNFVKLNIHFENTTRDLWVYLGKSNDYLIIPGVFCSCMDFIIRTVVNKASSYCKHQAGIYLAMNKNKYSVLDVDLKEAIIIIDEILNKGISVTLRRKLK